MLSISEAEIDWCLSILSESVQWTVTAKHRSVLLYKHLIPWFQHSVVGFSIMACYIPPLICAVSSTVKRYSSSLTVKKLPTGEFGFSGETHFVYCVSAAFAHTCTCWDLLVYFLECMALRVRVCAPACVSDSCRTERAEEHGDAVGCLCSGCGLLLRCPYWR